MKRPFTFLLLGFILFATNAYSAGLSVISKRPMGQLNEQLADGVISVTFDRPAASLSGDNQQESDNCPLKIRPSVEGSCRWVGTRRF